MLRRALAYALTFAVVFAAALPSAYARVNRHAALILDANTGAILHNVAGDAPRHPASLTKMMTLYLTFETLQSGRLKMSDKLTMSEHAAAAAPSKLDLDPGDQISISDAIRAIVTKSANDIAVALAEKVGGSEPNFARLMNARAREFGMTGTHYENASGLPNDAQITTAHDMAILALHLQDDFPQYYPLFSTKVFSYGGKSYRNHNTMLNTFAGVDGIKTGYTRASGFNLVTSWHRGNRHLIGVVFGGDTAAERNAEMRVLLTRLVSRASPVKTRKPMFLARLKGEPKIAHRPSPRKPAVEVAATRPISPPSPPENRNAAVSAASDETPVQIFKVRAVPIVAKAQRQAPSPDETTDMEDAGDTPAAGRTEIPQLRSFAPAGLPNAPMPLTTVSNRNVGASPANVRSPNAETSPPRMQQTLASAETHAAPVIRGLPPSTLGAQARALVAETGQGFEPRRGAPQKTSGGYAVQIGAYSSIDDAQRALTNVQGRAGRLLAGISSVTNPTMKNGHQIFRARFTGFDAGRATKTCNALRRQSVDCFVMAAD
ncbi:MAG: SPOR domain-containing protein [Proteobacteria bacterium]|nr:SPOR domain-containing protein [Pseudomonadota bacterium]